MSTSENDYPPMPAGFGTVQAWHDLIDAQRASNVEAKAERQARLKAEADADAAKRQAERDKQAEAQIAQFRAQARASWVGTQQQWDAAWPELLRKWQISQVQGTPVLDEMRKRMRDFSL